jgi:Mg2+/Co2+ transporter CorC
MFFAKIFIRGRDDNGGIVCSHSGRLPAAGEKIFIR